MSSSSAAGPPARWRRGGSRTRAWRSCSSSGDPDFLSSLFAADGASNYAGYSNPRVGLILANGVKTADQAARKKLYDLTDQPVLSGLEEIEQYRAIAAWEKHTSTGDRAELAELPEASALWHKLDARSDTCTGQKCSEWERCFITEMRRRALESDIIIVNHHLFFADLAIKLQADGAPDAGVLPEAAQ